MAIKINGITVAGKSGSDVQIDASLTQAGAAADAKATGDAIAAIPSWAKAATKPTYTANEIGAGTFTGQVVANSSGQAYNTYCLRNTRLASSDTKPTVNGEICWTYE